MRAHFWIHLFYPSADVLTVSEYTMAERSTTPKAEEAKEPTDEEELVPEELAGSLTHHLAAANDAAADVVQRLLVPLRILPLSSSETLHCLEQLQHHTSSSPPEKAALLLTLTDWAVAGLLGTGGLFQPDHGPAARRPVLAALAREWRRLLESSGPSLSAYQLAATRTALTRLIGAIPANSTELARSTRW